MPVKDAQTEQLIKETAMRIFFVEGRLHATTQVIADEAGVNRGLIYYYFKSRDILFQEVFKEAMMVIHNRLHELFLSKTIAFRDKIGQFVELFINQSIKYPYLEVFLVTEVNRDDFTPPVSLNAEIRDEMLSHIGKDLENEIRNGGLPKMSVEQFMTNLVSLCAYPILFRPMLQHMMKMDDKAYWKMINERKKLIMNVLFRN
ncbi:TetR/AcrR family transcriptional regulator [Chitinophaga tropicalis]|uniref:TetR family transcriptional regulator n=1 Tax=Chitinophaga tropicalis TaxID=2683588 RepID=A0A7K1U304_9BACT|nr:TetR/AcrR family transcriptional regulator [Chitinophaga tropicalis]MVT08747.1 TetR family transcriptional regulator [Chitinophaga tropicalis]